VESNVAPDSQTPDLTGVRIEVGTSGYSFKDWVGVFYPPGTPPGRMLEYYAQHFSVVEINTTYYGIPHPRVFAAMAVQVPPDFGFYVKVHQDVTHKREDPTASVRELYKAVVPLKERGMLRGFLAQFPYSFKKAPPATEYLVKLADLFAGVEPLFIEFRHTSWFKPIVYESLARHNLGFVNVDLPRLPRLPGPTAVVTNGEGYIRFHGRNAAAWWGSEGSKRYDYLYSEPELREWLPLIKEMSGKARRIITFMNNCHMGQAIKNARMLPALFGQGSEDL